MSTLHERFSALLVDARDGHDKRGGQHEASCFISTKVDPGDDIDIVIGKAVAGVPAHMKERVLKTGGIPARKELLGIGRIAPSAKSPGECELEVEQTVFAADRTVTASARNDFCGIWTYHGTYTFFAGFANFGQAVWTVAATHRQTARARGRPPARRAVRRLPGSTG